MQSLKHATYVLIAGILAVLVFGGTAAFLDIKQFETNMVEQTSRQLLAMAKSEAQSIQAFLDNMLDDLGFAATDANIISVLRESARRPLDGNDGRLAYFNTMGRRHAGRSSSVYLLDAEGKIVVRSPFDAEAIGKNCSMEPDILFSLECRHAAVSDPFMLDDGKTPCFSVTLPVVDGATFMGLIRCVIPLSNLKADMSRGEDAMEGAKARMYVISDNGHLLYGPHAHLRNKNRLTSILGASGNYDKFIERMKRGEEGHEVGETENYTDEKGVASKVIIAFVPVVVGKQNWSVGIATPYETVAAPLSQHTKKVLIFACMVLVSVMAASIGFYDIVRKRDRMTSDMEAVQMLRSVNTRLTAEVDERRKAEEALERTRDELEVRVRQRTADLVATNERLEKEVVERKRLESLRDNLIHMVVHDLKSPLCGITGYLDLAVQHGETALGKEIMYFIKEGLASAEDLLEMINSLLDVNRMEAGKLPLHKANTEIASLAERAIAKLSSLTLGKDVKLEKPGGGAWCVCDPDIMYRVILNLLTNALKYVPDSGGRVRIVFALENTHILVTVEDNGPGISSEYHTKIFEKFGRVENQNASKIYSTGLGLTFCKLAVEAHGGKIGVNSAEGRGSTFWINLPVGAPAPKSA